MAKPKIKSPLTRVSLPPSLSRGEIRKREIVEATIDCLATSGLWKTTFEAIGARAGIGKSHVLYHFPNLNQLILTAAKYAYATGQETVTHFLLAEEDYEKRLPAYIRGTFHWFRSHPKHMSVAALLVYQSMFEPDFRALQGHVRLIGTERIEAILAAMKIAKSHDKKSLHVLAENSQALLMGNLMYFATEARGDLEAIEEETLNAIHRMVHG